MIANSIKNMKQEMKGSEQPGINECTVYFVHLETGSVFKSEEFLLGNHHKVLSIVFKTTLYFRLILPGGDAAHPAVVPDTTGSSTGLHLGWLHRPPALPRQPARWSVHHHYHNICTAITITYCLPLHPQVCGSTCRGASAAAPGGWTARWPSSRAPTPASARSPRRTSAGAAPGSSCSAGV